MLKKLKIIFITGLLSISVGCSKEVEEIEFTIDEISGLEYRIIKDEYGNENYEVINPLYGEKIEATDIFAYSYVIVDLASLFTGKSEDELVMFEDMSEQVIKQKLGIYSFNDFSGNVLRDDDLLDKESYIKHYENNKSNPQFELASNRVGSRIDYNNYKFETGEISKYFSEEYDLLKACDENTPEEELDKIYLQIDNTVDRVYKYSDQYDPARYNYSEEYLKDREEAEKIKSNWTEYDKEIVTPDEMKEILESRPDINYKK